MTTLLYFGPQWDGSTSIQRLNAFQGLDGVRAIGIDNGAGVGGKGSLWRRVRWRLRLPVDVLAENEKLVKAVADHRPDIVLVDNSKVISVTTLQTLRTLGSKRLVYYSPDDIVSTHNLSFPLKWSLPWWDVVFTTKTFNVPELASLGVRCPMLVGKAFDAELHKPWHKEHVGADFERFDVVFIGTFEKERCASINALAAAGVSVVVYGADAGNWKGRKLHPTIELRNSFFGEEYVRAWHTGKVALCFLRKINRDRITQRTMEIAAIGRPMVAERTDEHDAHFQHGLEYFGFHDDAEMVDQVKALINNHDLRISIGAAARERCMNNGYSTTARAMQMMKALIE